MPYSALATATTLRLVALPLARDPGSGGVSVLIQDLTEIRRVDDVRRDFVANVSHELRTPVASTLALAETLLLRAERHPEIVTEYSEQIRQQARRLAELVDDLLRLSEIESGRLRIDPFSVDQVGPASIDLHLGDEIRVLGRGPGAIDVKDDEIWKIVAFVKKLPSVSEADFKAWTAR